MKIGERYLIKAEFLQSMCQIGDFCGWQGEEWLHVQQEEQLQTGQAEHLTMQNAQCKTSRISQNAGQAEYPNPKCRKIRIFQSTVQEKQNFTVYCRQEIVQSTMQECRASRIARDAAH